MAQDILKSFQGTTLAPRRGGNLANREFTGIRLSILKKGQNQITFGKDVLDAVGVKEIPTKVTVVVGEDKQAGKLLVKFGEGPFHLRHSNAKKPSSAHIMSSTLPLTKAVASAAYKVFPESNALVLELPAAAPADDASIV